jgi:hypothetical protein
MDGDVVTSHTAPCFVVYGGVERGQPWSGGSRNEFQGNESSDVGHSKGFEKQERRKTFVFRRTCGRHDENFGFDRESFAFGFLDFHAPRERARGC